MTNAELIGYVKKKKIVIVGAGDVGKYLFQLLQAEEMGSEIVVCDNSHKKQHTFKGGEVLSVVNAVKLFPKALYLVTSRIHEITMNSQLVGLGVPSENILFGVTVEAQDYLTEKIRAIKLRPLEKLQFEVDIVAHCNLNCKCCSQFSCIAKEEYIDIKTMERDFSRLGELFKGVANRIYLIGGEPLLHPQINECMKIARRYFPKGKIAVFTNGILLLKCRESFWGTCREQRISIIVTKYPINLNYEEIIKKAESEGVAFEFFGSSEDYKYMTNLGLELDGSQDIFESFANCLEGNNCIKLKNGKLFTCTRPAVIDRFNNYFDKQLKVSEDDFIDIYEVENKEEILRKLARPIPFCKYCNLLGGRKAMNWGQTEKKIEEWL